MQSIKELKMHISEDRSEPRQAGEVEIGGTEILELLSQFSRFGVWRSDIETSLFYWSPDVFAIYGWPVREGPVDFRKAIEAYHPEDRALVLDCLSETAARKSGFRFVLRLIQPDGTYKFVEANGRHRVNEHGREEIYGSLSEFREVIRAVTVNP